MELPKRSTEWCLPWQQKKALYGKKHLIAVGGKTETTEETEKPDMDRLGNKPEPVCFHSMPGAFYAELMHSFWAKMVIDLTPGDGRFAFEALKARVGYLGITFTAEHSQFLEEHLLDLMKLEMCDSASPLFNSEYAVARGKKAPKAKATPAPDVDPKKKPKTKPTPKRGAEEQEPADPKAKPKKKAKAKKKAQKDEDQEPEDEDAEEAEDEEPEEDDDDVWDPLAT